MQHPHLSACFFDLAELLEGGLVAAAVMLGGARIAAASSFAAGGASSTVRSCDGKSFELRA